MKGAFLHRRPTRQPTDLSLGTMSAEQRCEWAHTHFTMEVAKIMLKSLQVSVSLCEHNRRIVFPRDFASSYKPISSTQCTSSSLSGTRKRSRANTKSQRSRCPFYSRNSVMFQMRCRGDFPGATYQVPPTCEPAERLPLPPQHSDTTATKIAPELLKIDDSNLNCNKSPRNANTMLFVEQSSPPLT